MPRGLLDIEDAQRDERSSLGVLQINARAIRLIAVRLEKLANTDISEDEIEMDTLRRDLTNMENNLRNLRLRFGG